MGNWIPRNLGYAPHRKLADLSAKASKKKAKAFGSETREQIDRCLNCTRPPEMCHGCTEGVKVSVGSADGLPGRPSKFDREVVQEMMLQGWTQVEVASYFGVHPSTASRWFKTIREEGLK